MRTAEEIAVGVVCGMDTMRQPYNWCVSRVADAIRAARIEAVEEFRWRAIRCVAQLYGASWDTKLQSAIAALPALPEGA